MVGSELFSRLSMIFLRTDNNISSALLIDVPDVHLVKHLWQCHVSGMMESSKQVEVVTPVHHSDMAVIAQHHPPFFATVQNVGAVHLLDNRLYDSDGDEATAVFDAMVAKGSLQLSSMRCVKVTKRVLHILNLVDSVSDGHTLVSRCVKAAYVNDRTLFVVIVPDGPAFRAVCVALGLDTGRAAGAFFGCHTQHGLTVTRAQASGVHMHKIEGTSFIT